MRHWIIVALVAIIAAAVGAGAALYFAYPAQVSWPSARRVAHFCR